MTTVLYTHPICAEHDAGDFHPERPERLGAVLAALGDEAFSALERRQAPLIEVAELERVHQPAYVRRVLDGVPATGHVQLDADTAMSPASGEAALRAAGAVSAAVDAVLGGEADNAFCAVRPPGHHAEAGRAMGFCLFNNVAVAAEHARAKHGLERVAVVDFDVHHGNGTQHSFEKDPGLFFASTHQMPCYPGTGHAEETGVGNIVNCPLPPGAGSDAFRAAVEERVLPALSAFAPELLLVSAGFDAHAQDPLAQLQLTEHDFAWVTRRLLDVAKACCGGRVVSHMEGGYSLEALAASAAAHVRVLMEG